MISFAGKLARFFSVYKNELAYFVLSSIKRLKPDVMLLVVFSADASERVGR